MLFMVPILKTGSVAFTSDDAWLQSRYETWSNMMAHDVLSVFGLIRLSNIFSIKIRKMHFASHLHLGLHTQLFLQNYLILVKLHNRNN